MVGGSLEKPLRKTKMLSYTGMMQGGSCYRQMGKNHWRGGENTEMS